jgi:hypothetical protein
MLHLILTRDFHSGLAPLEAVLHVQRELLPVERHIILSGDTVHELWRETDDETGEEYTVQRCFSVGDDCPYCEGENSCPGILDTPCEQQCDGAYVTSRDGVRPDEVCPYCHELECDWLNDKPETMCLEAWDEVDVYVDGTVKRNSL